jgi:aminocarboxymuconate-semialdehyde decarboxylase
VALASLAGTVMIDVHAHHYSGFYLKELRGPRSPLESRRDDATGYESFYSRGGLAMGLPPGAPNISTRLSVMDSAGIDIQVLSMAGPSLAFLGPSAAVEMTRAINDDLLEICRASDGRLLMFASVELPESEASVAELSRVAHHREVVGVILRTHVNGRRFDDPSLSPFFDEVNRLAFPVFIHPTSPIDQEITEWGGLALLMGFPHETAKVIANMHFARMFDRYPAINWIFCHLGGGIHAIWDRFVKSGERLGLWQPPEMSFGEVSTRIFYDCVTAHAPAIRLTHDTVGPSQIVFGSDCPHVPIDSSLVALRALQLPEDEERMILVENARRVLRRDPE